MGEEKSSKERAPAGLTPRALLAVIILTIIFTFINAHGYQVTGTALFYNRWPYEWQNGVPIISMGLVFLLIVIMDVLKVKARFTTAELATVALAGLILSAPITTVNFSYILLTQAGMSAPGNEWAYEYVRKSPWHVPKEAADILRAGPSAAPWGLMMTPLMTWTVTWLLWAFLAFFMACLMRRRVADIEKMPFPYAQPVIQLIEYSKPEPGFTSSKIATSAFIGYRRFWLGVVLGFLAYIFFLPRYWWPWFPAPQTKEYGWYTMWMLNLYGNTPIKTVLPTAHSCFWIDPMVIAVALFIPTDILFTAGWGWFFLSWICSEITWRLGLTPAPPVGGYEDQYSAGWYIVENYRLYWLFESGGLIAIGLFTLIFAGKYLIGTLKAIGKPMPDEAEREPLSYRLSWIGFIVTFIVYIGWLTYIGIPAGVAFLILVYMFFFFMTMIRLKAESGFIHYWHGWPANEYALGYGRLLGLWPPITPENQLGAYMAAGFNSWTFGYISSATLSGVYLEGFRIADASGLRPKHAAATFVLVTIITILFAGIFTVWSAFALGLARLQVRPPWAIGHGVWPANYVRDGVTTIGYWDTPFPEGLTGFHYTIIGIFIYAIIFFLRMRLPWFPINPIGLIMFSGNNIKVATTFWVTWWIKWIILKVGGTPLFEKLVPVIVGIVVGSFLSLLLVVVTGMVFWMPLPI
ncbi:MAG: DUF6785 family protein [Candidatus Bathyarchaeia archaeon]